MRQIFQIILIFTILISCSYPSSKSSKQQTTKTEDDTYLINSYSYDSLNISSFFDALIKNHIKDYWEIDSITFYSLCNNSLLNFSDSGNIHKFYKLLILHELFTCQGAYNCSKGSILNIPYQWHWVSPNPRYEIFFTGNGKLLKDTKPPAEFSKYNSYADIDRTPFLFLNDLLEPIPKYYSESCDTFSTFGWCSEREMAFVCLLDIFNFEGKVIANGNHSWSEFYVQLTTTNGLLKHFLVTVDNTFNRLNWNEVTNTEIDNWRKNTKIPKQAIWYNEKAHSISEKEKIKKRIASPEAMKKIEQSMVEYLETQMKG